MNPAVMFILLLVGWGAFAYSAWRRWKLMRVGAAEDRFDQPVERLRRTLVYAIAQLRMRRYLLAGIAHMLIFLGFGVLLLRTLVLWGRGFDPGFDFWVFGTDRWLGRVYSFLKDLFAVLVILGTLVFVYYRVIRRLSRMTLSGEGLMILGIILAMMGADILYDGAALALDARTRATVAAGVTPHRDPNRPEIREVIALRDLVDEQGRVTGRVPVSSYREPTPEERKAIASARVPFIPYEPAGSLVGKLIVGLPDSVLRVLGHAGFWTHSTLVLIFLNLLPYSKHFHVITGIPNVYFQSLNPPGRLPPIEDIDGKLEREETLGIRRIDQFSWKSILDFYTCTECGRCSDHCPATKTGKKLSPKHFTLDLRNFLYKHEQALVERDAKFTSADAANPGVSDPSRDREGAVAIPEPHQQTDSTGVGEGSGNGDGHRVNLVDGTIDPEVLWACTSCRACEQECPVFITYVDKIVDLRRYLVQERGEFPPQLQSAFRGLESTANPWSFPAEDRAKWADGLDVPTLADKPDAEVLFWVGCMPSFDERAKRVARATASLLKRAGVNFAILGTQEQCTGDPARRAGNEYLFQMFAKANVELLNGYDVDKKTVVTTCPHCFNTLLNEYPDFGGRYRVVHHATYLTELIRNGKLPVRASPGRRVVYHDSCYLGRYNDVYDAPREVLSGIGLTVLEPAATRDRGMCCGAGGAQMFKEEEPGTERVNVLRTRQLLDTSADVIASACPFCMRMLTDGLAHHERENVPQLDIAELLLESVETWTPGAA